MGVLNLFLLCVMSASFCLGTTPLTRLMGINLMDKGLGYRRVKKGTVNKSNKGLENQKLGNEGLRNKTSNIKFSARPHKGKIYYEHACEGGFVQKGDLLGKVVQLTSPWYVKDEELMAPCDGFLQKTGPDGQYPYFGLPIKFTPILDEDAEMVDYILHDVADYPTRDPTDRIED